MAYLLRSHLGACKTVLLTLREGAGRGGGGCVYVTDKITPIWEEVLHQLVITLILNLNSFV